MVAAIFWPALEGNLRDRSKKMFGFLKAIAKNIFYGVLPFALFVYPIVVGSLAYLLCAFFGILWKSEIAIIAGFVALAFLPCYILGDVFLSIKNQIPLAPQPAQAREYLDTKDLIEVWKKCVDVQMHFNTIELQIRNYAVTLLVAVIGAAAYALKEHLEVKLFGHTYSMAVAVLPAGILGWSAFYFMDRHWYHRLLWGAVKQAAKIERVLGPDLQLGEEITNESPIPILDKKIHSTQKIDLFYAAGLTFLIVITGFILLRDVSFAPAKTSTTPEVHSKESTESPRSEPQPLAPPAPKAQPAQPEREPKQTEAPLSK